MLSGGHQVVCRRCFVKTIQSAVAQRLLPLRCVICRARINRLTSSSGTYRLQESASSYSVGSKSWSVSRLISISLRIFLSTLLSGSWVGKFIQRRCALFTRLHNGRESDTVGKLIFNEFWFVVCFR